MPKVHYLDHKPTLEEAQKLVEGYVEPVGLPDGRQMLVNEEGLLKRLAYNHEASLLTFGQHHIVGNAIVLKEPNRWGDGEEDDEV